MNFYLNMVSGNKKTGTMPVSTSHAGTCPSTCPFKEKGCYAKAGPLAMHWRKVTDGERGTDWKGFLLQVRKIPRGTLWRMNQAGDLVGTNNLIDRSALMELVNASRKTKAFSYTHYPLTEENVETLKMANNSGFTVNVSTNRRGEVDSAMKTGLPVVTVLPVGTTERVLSTPEGNKILVCPASRGVELTCKECQLCQKRDRSFAIGFVAHGVSKKNLGK